MATELTISQAIEKQKTPSGFGALSKQQQKEHRAKIGVDDLPMSNLTRPSGFGALSPSEQLAHREKIGVRARATLRQFWIDAGTTDVDQALELEGWCDVLEDCSHSEIRKAWATYLKTGPRTNKDGPLGKKKLYKPDAGILYLIIQAARPRPTVVPTPEPERAPPATKEQAAEILKQVGYSPKAFGAKKE